MGEHHDIVRPPSDDDVNQIGAACFLIPPCLDASTLSYCFSDHHISLTTQLAILIILGEQGFFSAEAFTTLNGA